MSLANRIRNILLTPRTEWAAIQEEHDKPLQLLTRYVLPLLLVGSLAAFIGYGLIGMDATFFKIKGIKWGVWFAVRHLVSGVLGYFIATVVIDALAPGFSSEKNLNRSAQLVAYASTPSWVVAIFQVIPQLGLLGLMGLYGIYLFYLGLPVMKKTPDDKRITYMVVSAVIIVLVSWLAQWVIGLLLNPVLGDPYAGSVQELQQMFNQ